MKRICPCNSLYPLCFLLHVISCKTHLAITSHGCPFTILTWSESEHAAASPFLERAIKWARKFGSIACSGTQNGAVPWVLPFVVLNLLRWISGQTLGRAQQGIALEIAATSGWFSRIISDLQSLVGSWIWERFLAIVALVSRRSRFNFRFHWFWKGSEFGIPSSYGNYRKSRQELSKTKTSLFLTNMTMILDDPFLNLKHYGCDHFRDMLHTFSSSSLDATSRGQEHILA